MLIENNLSVTLGGDASGQRIFYPANGSANGSLNTAVFESTVAFRSKSTVLQYQIMGITKWLFAGNMAIYQTQVP